MLQNDIPYLPISRYFFAFNLIFFSFFSSLHALYISFPVFGVKFSQLLLHCCVRVCAVVLYILLHIVMLCAHNNDTAAARRFLPLPAFCYKAKLLLFSAANRFKHCNIYYTVYTHAVYAFIIIIIIMNDYPSMLVAVAVTRYSWSYSPGQWSVK